jgi:outer membrane protein assembly factor BamB
MKKNERKGNQLPSVPIKLFFVLLFFVIISAAVSAMPGGTIAGGHRANVTSIIHNENTIISADEEGFLVIWNVHNRTASERFQLTSYKITNMIKHPSRDEICIIEYAGIDHYRITVWNYRQKNRIFSLYSAQPITYINYSASGRYLITAGFNGSYLTLLDSVTGEIVLTPNIPPGTVSLAVTGRAERNMLLYQSELEDDIFSGQILYLDLESVSVTRSFQAPENLVNPIIFGNNRFIAGSRSGNLLILDAASGAVIDSRSTEGRVLLFPQNDDFFYLEVFETHSRLNRFFINNAGRITARPNSLVNINTPVPISIFAFNRNAVFASTSGQVFFISRQGSIEPFVYNFQRQIMEIGVSEKKIAFLTDNGELGFLPLDYRQLENRQILALRDKTGYSRLTPIPCILGEEDSARFILWQNNNNQLPPQIVHENNLSGDFNLPFMIGRFPLRSISAKNNRVLVLNSAGNIAIHNLEVNTISERASFTFSSVGAIDAVIVDNDRFLLCRSVVRGTSPFLFVNFITGETVPIAFPAQAGIMSYTGSSGNIYAAAIESTISGERTAIIEISIAGSKRVYEYEWEVVNLAIAESGGMLAIATGSEGAFILSRRTEYFERTSGLPLKLSGSNNFFISLDSEGNISWHDNRTGGLLASFKLFDDSWTLLRDNVNVISGNVSR